MPPHCSGFRELLAGIGTERMQFQVEETGESAGEDELGDTGHGRDKCAGKVQARVRQQF